MRKLFRQIHLWLSVPFGLIITLICLSGAMLVFEDEINELCHRELYFVKRVDTTPLPIDQLLEKVCATLPDSVSVTGVSIASDPERTYQVSLSKPRRSSLYVNQYTGEITGKSQRSGFFMFMFRMHRWLLDSMNPNGGVFVGKLIVGVSTLLFIVVLISGVIIWWPRTRKTLKSSLKISYSKGWKRFWYDLHIAGGMYGFILLLAMSLTGLTWSFPWYRTAFYKIFGVEVQQQANHGGHQQSGYSQKGDDALAQQDSKRVEKGSDIEHGHRGNLSKNRHGGNTHSKREHGELHEQVAPSAFAYWQEIYTELSRRNPEYKKISISSGSANVSFNRFGNQRAADRYTFSNDNGEITETSLYQHQDKAGKIRGWIYSVHVGDWGGMLTRMLTFLTALLGATLPLTGYYLWFKKMMNKKKYVKSISLSTEKEKEIA